MKITDIRLATHIGMQIKAHWLGKKKVKVLTSPAEAFLLSKGIEVVNAKDVLRPALIEEPFERKNSVLAPEEKPQCYIFKNSFVPLANVEQCQLITNSLVFDSLPESILEKVKDTTPQDEEAIIKAVLHSHVLDAQQDKLQHRFNYDKHPGYNPPRKYGIKCNRKIESLLYHLALYLNQTADAKELKHILENVVSRVTFEHDDNLIHFYHQAKMVLCSRTPLAPVLDSKEVQANAGAEMPDIFPLSPFIHCKPQKFYDDLKEGTAVPVGSVWPQTVFVGYTSDVNFILTPGQFYGMSLLHAFSHAAAFARRENKDLSGDLTKPVSVNVVHTNGQYFHVGRFQLNTLDCTGPTRNMFWFEPWIQIFETAGFESARPVVERVNTRPLALLRALGC